VLTQAIICAISHVVASFASWHHPSVVAWPAPLQVHLRPAHPLRSSCIGAHVITCECRAPLLTQPSDCATELRVQACV
jgi:hypothetical protein